MLLLCQACQFLDHEAEVSEDGLSGDDDEDDGSDVDSLDGSFIDDDTLLTQAPTTTQCWYLFYTLPQKSIPRSCLLPSGIVVPNRPFS